MQTTLKYRIKHLTSKCIKGVKDNLTNEKDN